MRQTDLIQPTESQRYYGLQNGRELKTLTLRHLNRCCIHTTHITKKKKKKPFVRFLGKGPPPAILLLGTLLKCRSAKCSRDDHWNRKSKNGQRDRVTAFNIYVLASFWNHFKAVPISIFLNCHRSLSFNICILQLNGKLKLWSNQIFKYQKRENKYF